MSDFVYKYAYGHLYVRLHTRNPPKFVSEFLRVCRDACKDVYIYIFFLYTKSETIYAVVYYIHTIYWIHCIRHGTGWRRLIGSPKLQIIFHKRAIRYRSLLRKMMYKDKGSYESSPPCTWNIYSLAHSIVLQIHHSVLFPSRSHSLPRPICMI